MKKLRKGVPFARPPSAARPILGRTSGSANSIGNRNDMTSVELGTSDATRRTVAAIASSIRYVLIPVEATIAGRVASKPAPASRSHHLSPPSNST